MTCEERYKRIEHKFSDLEKGLVTVSQTAIDHMKHKPYGGSGYKGPKRKVSIKKGVSNNG